MIFHELHLLVCDFIVCLLSSLQEMSKEFTDIIFYKVDVDKNDVRMKFTV